jgi:hypothetical protein
VLNATPANLQEPKSPQGLFHGVDTRPNLKYFQPFACPAFVLDNRLQTAKKIPKWELRARIGMYLGMSTQHARSVALILNLTTGHVSPKFHVRFDPSFSTVMGNQGTICPRVKWLEEAGFYWKYPSHSVEFRFIFVKAIH